MRRGAFRQDLFFRLNGITLTIPPLRERPDGDRAAGARASWPGVGARSGRAAPACRRGAGRADRYAWPGNIRELRNVMERALVLCDGSDDPRPSTCPSRRCGWRGWCRPARRRLLPDVRPGGVRAAADRPGSADERAERRKVIVVMAEVGGNQTRAAKKLGMARGTLIERLKRYGIKRPQNRGD